MRLLALALIAATSAACAHGAGARCSTLPSGPHCDEGYYCDTLGGGAPPPWPARTDGHCRSVNAPPYE